MLNADRGIGVKDGPQERLWVGLRADNLIAGDNWPNVETQVEAVNIA